MSECHACLKTKPDVIKREVNLGREPIPTCEDCRDIARSLGKQPADPGVPPEGLA